MLIDLLKSNEKIKRADIIDWIDSSFGQKKMRRTYDVLNILYVAGVIKHNNKKEHYYNPLILEGEEAVEEQNYSN